MFKVRSGLLGSSALGIIALGMTMGQSRVRFRIAGSRLKCVASVMHPTQ